MFQSLHLKSPRRKRYLEFLFWNQCHVPQGSEPESKGNSFTFESFSNLTQTASIVFVFSLCFLVVYFHSSIFSLIGIITASIRRAETFKVSHLCIQLCAAPSRTKHVLSAGCCQARPVEYKVPTCQFS